MPTELIRYSCEVSIRHIPICPAAPSGRKRTWILPWTQQRQSLATHSFEVCQESGKIVLACRIPGWGWGGWRMPSRTISQCTGGSCGWRPIANSVCNLHSLRYEECTNHSNSPWPPCWIVRTQNTDGFPEAGVWTSLGPATP